MADEIVVRGAREHNLADVSLVLPRDQLVVFTGISGSGKSSLAFDTIYAEGQRRYVESLSSYARQFLGQMDKPDVDFIEGLSPAISIDQKSASRNPRSTVGTVTEVYDYLRLLFARVGVPHDPVTGERLVKQTPQEIVDRVMGLGEGLRFEVLAPVVRGRKGTYGALLEGLLEQGFSRVYVDDVLWELADVAGGGGGSGSEGSGPGEGESGLELARYEMHDISVVVDRLVLRDGIERRLTDSVEVALGLAEGVVQIRLAGERSESGDTGGKGKKQAKVEAEVLVFSQHLARPSDGESFEELAPRNFSFNSPYGACAHCDGLGSVFEVDPRLVVPNEDLSLQEGALAPWSSGHAMYYHRLLEAVSGELGVSFTQSWASLPKKAKQVFLEGGIGHKVPVRFRNRHGRVRTYDANFEGVIPYLRRRHQESTSDRAREQIESYMRQVDCAECSGARLRPLPLAVTVDGHNIHEICSLPITDAAQLLNSLELSERDQLIASRVLKETRLRLEFLVDVGLGYLSLSRSAGTLSGGEAQRIRLASQIGSGLVGVLYVLDEPSIGLHQRDNARLLETLERLRNLGNTVLVVEHDEETIRRADHVVDIGPGAGEHGGKIVHSGPPAELARNTESLTGDYLSGRKAIAVPAKRRAPKDEWLWVRGAQEHNLKNIDVRFPLGCFVAVTGVSGSGKSTLVNEILYQALMSKIYHSRVVPGLHKAIDGIEHIDKVINIDQQPIGRTPRSNAATYIGVFTHIRKLFANTVEARTRGYEVGRFSFNVDGGRCGACTGDGTLRIEMHFLPDVYVPCEVCQGARYNRDTLEVKYRGKNIAEVLNCSVSQALELFENQPVIARHLQTLVDVGLGYIRLGQPAPTLSGGEAQRVKLASELSKRATGHTVYLLDEPTTGLHFEDIRKLLGVLSRLVDAGNTVLVIEHNLDVVKTADWIIDLGPDGGAGGGQVVAEGSPETVAQCEGSATGLFLQPVLGGGAAAASKTAKAGKTGKATTASKPTKTAKTSKAAVASKNGQAGKSAAAGKAAKTTKPGKTAKNGQVATAAKTSKTAKAGKTRKPAKAGKSSS